MEEKDNIKIIKNVYCAHEMQGIGEVKESIEELKYKLDSLLSNNNLLSISNEILRVSQELDEQINIFMKIKNDKI